VREGEVGKAQVEEAVVEEMGAAVGEAVAAEDKA
jgi:hypothetical protein